MPRPVVTVELGDSLGVFGTDISAYVDLKKGISITRGRGDEFADVEASTCSMTLDNTTGMFSYGQGVASSNLLSNGSFERDWDTGALEPDWTPTEAPGSFTAGRTTAQHKGGDYCYFLTDTAGTTTELSVYNRVVTGLVAGQSYVLSGYLRAKSTGRKVRVGPAWRNSLGQGLSVDPPFIDLATDSSSDWTYFSVVLVAPPTAVGLQLLLGPIPSPGGTLGAGETHYLDKLSLEVGTKPGPYFDGPGWFTVSLDMPIRVSVTVGAVTTARFTGDVKTWPVSWPGGQRSSVAAISATDQMAKLARRRLRSVVEQTVLESAPEEYFVLSEDETSLSAGDTSGKGRSALTVTQRGAGGTLQFGAGTGPATDAHSSPILTRATATDGLYLDGPGPGLPLDDGPVGSGYAMRVIVTSTLVAAQTFFRVKSTDYYSLEIGCNSSGHLTVIGVGGAGFTMTQAVNVANGVTHDLILTAIRAADFTYDLSLYKDGVLVATSNQVGIFKLNGLSIGGAPFPAASPLASATISHAAVFGVPLTTTAIARLRASMSSGFSTDSSNARIARIAGWAGIAADDMTLETGSLDDTAHLDTTDMSPVEAMQRVAQSEQGLVFFDGSGMLIFHARTHRYGPDTDLALTAPDLGIDSEFTLDTQGLVNLVTAQRPNGAKQTVRNADSIARYDEFPEELTLLVPTDDEALQAASWRASVHAEPSARLGALPVDLLTQTSALAIAAQALTLGDVISLSGLPSQAPLSASRLFVEGWTEQLGYSDWSMTFNTSPLNVVVWKLEDPVYGQIDAMNRLAY